MTHMVSTHCERTVMVNTLWSLGVPTHELAMMLGVRHRDLVNKLKAECTEDGEDWTRKFRSQKAHQHIA